MTALPPDPPADSGSSAVPDPDPAPGLESPTAEPSSDAPAELDVDDLPAGLRGALEAVLMVVEEPLDAPTLASTLRRPTRDVEDTLRALADEYARDRRGFALLEVAGGWRVYSRSEYAPVVERFLLDGQRARLTQAALETLAVVAYRQPVSRARVSAVRGVNVDGVVRTLLTRGLITEVGVDDEHGAVLYGTTPYFLQRLGLGSLDDLPPLAPYLPEIDMLDSLTDASTDRLSS